MLIGGFESRGNVDGVAIRSVIEETTPAEIADNRWPGMGANARNPIEAPVHSTAEVEAVMTKLGRESGAGLIIMPDTFTYANRETIISIANRDRLPAIYPFRVFAVAGGLLSYGIDLANSLRGAAMYVDRILRGAKPNELPAQLPTKFEMIINLKTAKALGLSIPDRLLITADEVIE